MLGRPQGLATTTRNLACGSCCIRRVLHTQRCQVAWDSSRLEFITAFSQREQTDLDAKIVNIATNLQANCQGLTTHHN